MKAGRAAPSGAPRCGERACVPLGGGGGSTQARGAEPFITASHSRLALLSSSMGLCVRRSCLRLRTGWGARHLGRGEVGEAVAFAGTAGRLPGWLTYLWCFLPAPVGGDDSLF